MITLQKVIPLKMFQMQGAEISSKLKAQSSKLKAQSSKLKAQSSKLEAQRAINQLLSAFSFRLSALMQRSRWSIFSGISYNLRYVSEEEKN